MNRQKRVLVLPAIIILILMLPAGLIGATNMAPDVSGTQLAILPATESIPVNGTISVDIVISDVVDLYGTSVTISFDPAVLEVVDADGGKSGVQITPGVCPIPDFSLLNTADNSTGTINYDVASLAPSVACSGSGAVATIEFRAKAVGVSTIQFSDWLLSDKDGIAVDATDNPGEITVSGDPPSETTLKVDPSPASIPNGGEATVDIVVENVADLYGTSLILLFDPAVVEVVDADGNGGNGVQISPGVCPSPDFVVQNAADNSAGVINFDASSLSPAPACSGTGVIASITFRGIGSGDSALQFDTWLLSDSNGIEIPATPTDGLLQVELSTQIYFEPSVSELAVNDTIDVSIMVTDVTNLFGVQLEIAFDAERLQVVDADGANGVQITPGGCPSPDFVLQNSADNTLGTILYATTSLATSSVPCNGTGTVATITFSGKAKGAADISFFSHLLSDTDGFAIPAGTQSAAVNVIDAGVMSGEVTLQGRLDHSGTTVSIWQSTTKITETVLTSSGEFNFPLPAGTYDVHVEMERYLDAEKMSISITAGNTTTLSSVELLGGDSNDDDTINILDLTLMGSNFTKTCASAGWNVNADINDDCKVNIQDLTIAGSNFMQSSPVSWP